MYDWLDRAALRRPERLAIEVPGEGSLTYEQLRTDANRQADVLHRAGVAPSTTCALEYEGGLEFAARLHGTLAVGAAAVPIDARLSQPEQARRRLLLGLPYPDVATVMFTSGTTSVPKPVHLTLANWQANAVGSALALGLDQNERWLCPMPLAHVGGMSILLRSTLYATTVVLHPRYQTEAVLEELMRPNRAMTLVSLVPTMLARLLDAGLQDPPTLRWVLLGGGPTPAPLLARAAAAGVPVAPTYGMTEGCSQIATFGVPLHGVELRLDDGEIVVRGPNVAANCLDPDGWLHTGDLGALDQRGRLKIIGRSADTIVSGGENVAPVEVEEALMEHGAVADAGVFARADPQWGERVVAKVVLRAGGRVTPQELERFLAGRLARFKVPKEIEYAQELPRTVSGKLLRRELR
ncbi:MAG: class I adenylate-forming enzyme family protein [Solirubrobacteraceae bacterium]